MLVKRLTLAAGVETAFEFDEYAANSVVVKNETSGEILFCDGPFDAAKAAHIPAFSWQSLNVRVFPGETPAFYVKATVSGVVEIDFGPSGMGVLGNVKLSGSIVGVATEVTAGVASGVALAANAARKYASFQNDSDTIIYLYIGAAAALNKGTRLNPNGGSYEMSAAGGNLDLRVVNCISSAAAKNLLVREG